MYKTEGVVRLIPLDQIPRSGQLIVAVHFNDYKQYYANETRKALLNLPKRRDVKKIDIEFYPLDYWLKRAIVSESSDDEIESKVKQKRWSITRATGGLYKIGYTNMTPDKFKQLYSVLEKMKKTYWDEFEILIGSKIEGY